MSTVPHSVPSRLSHLTAELYGREDDTLVAWRQTCVHASDALRTQYAGERLTKALTLAQSGAVELVDDGFAVVTSDKKRYQVAADATCKCADFVHRRQPCKHVLAAIIHANTLLLLERSTALPAAPPTAPPAEPEVVAALAAPAAAPAVAPRAAAWRVQEAPASCCLRLRVGEIEIMYTMRDVSDTELTSRVQHLLPWVQDALDLARERQASLAAQRQQRDAAPAVPAAPPQPPTSSVSSDLQTLVEQAVQHALAMQSPGTAGANGPAARAPKRQKQASDQQTGQCSIHDTAMDLHQNERGEWYSHYLEDEERYCKGAK